MPCAYTVHFIVCAIVGSRGGLGRGADMECTLFLYRHGMKTLLFLTFLLFVPCRLFPGEISGKVIAVTDGDTITIIEGSNTRFRIRLEKKQAFGSRTKQILFLDRTDLTFEYEPPRALPPPDMAGAPTVRIHVNEIVGGAGMEVMHPYRHSEVILVVEGV